jgi:DNA end-binding protein Ku
MPVRKGVIVFGLVSIPVELHVAARSSTLDFDLLHAPDKGRIRYKLWCAEEGRAVSRQETVKAYRVDGTYVVMEPGDFEQAERATTRAIEVRHFVGLAGVDPIYFERSYWVGPGADAERSYRVLLEAMRNTKTGAVVTFVMSDRQHVALLRAAADKLALHTLYYGDEVRALKADWKEPKRNPREVRFAEQYIEALRADFAPGEYRDEYRDTLLRIIRAKAAGEAAAVPERPKPPAKVRSLLDALRRSVEEARKPLARAEGARTRARQPRRRSARAAA